MQKHTENIKNFQTSECLFALSEYRTSQPQHDPIFNRGVVSVDHTARQMLDPIRTPKLRSARPGEYLAGGPPGKLEESTLTFRFSDIPIFDAFF